MSDAQKLIAAILRRSQRCRPNSCDCETCTAIWADRAAAEIDKALGGLTRETVDKPEFRETGEMVPSPLIFGPEMVPETRLHFIPSERWVTGWSEVRS